MPAPPMAVRLAADLRPSADGSAVHTSLVAGHCRQRAIAYRLGQRNGRTEGQMAVSLTVPCGGGIITGLEFRIGRVRL